MLWFVGSVFVALGNFSISPEILLAVPVAILWVFAASLLRTRGSHRLATWLEANALLYGQSLPAFMIMAPIASMAFPLVDARLAAWDAALGFDWPGAAYALKPYLTPLWFAYTSFKWQPLVAIAFLAAFDQERCWHYVTASMAALFATSLIFPFFPAHGAFLFHGITPQEYPPFTDQSLPWSWLPAFDKLRDGYHVLDSSVMVGMVSFPSYHTVAGVLTAWAAWPFRYARWPAILLNAGLIIGALIFGSHYLSDLISGAIVAIAALAFTHSIQSTKPFLPAP